MDRVFKIEDFRWEREWYLYNTEFHYKDWYVDLPRVAWASAVRADGVKRTRRQVHPIYRGGKFIAAVDVMFYHMFVNGIQDPLLMALEELYKMGPVASKTARPTGDFIIAIPPILQCDEPLGAVYVTYVTGRTKIGIIYNARSLGRLTNNSSFWRRQDAAEDIITGYGHYHLEERAYWRSRLIATVFATDLFDFTQLSPEFWEMVANLRRPCDRVPTVKYSSRTPDEVTVTINEDN